MNFGDVSCLFTFSCLFTLDQNSAIIADRTLLLQYKVTRCENYDFWWCPLFVYFQLLVYFSSLPCYIWRFDLPKVAQNFPIWKNLWFLAESDQTNRDTYFSSRVYRAIALLLSTQGPEKLFLVAAVTEERWPVGFHHSVTPWLSGL